MDNDLPDDAVEMVRAIRNRHYEDTKHMTIEEKWAHDQKDYDEFKALMEKSQPDYDRFPFLARR
jgi:predicted unusual protein kinase regulating ubiquinone biosynthesis (AarF/ABC1/UbiB family)